MRKPENWRKDIVNDVFQKIPNKHIFRIFASKYVKKQ